MDRQLVTPADLQPSPVDDLAPRGWSVLPLNDAVLFPGMLLPLVVNIQRSMKLAEDVAAGDRLFVAVLQRDGGQPDDQVGPSELYSVGYIARWLRSLRFSDGSLRILVQGERRSRIERYEGGGRPYLWAVVTPLADTDSQGLKVEALAQTASQLFQDVISMSPSLPEELKVALFNIQEASRLADLIAANLNMPLTERQALLETVSVHARLERIVVLLNREKEVLNLGRKVQQRVSGTFGNRQREFFLREQLKQIHIELGEDTCDDLSRLRQRIEQAGLSSEAREAAERELQRLSVIPTVSPEYSVVRTYLDWLLELPWSRSTEDRLDLHAARRILESAHYGLQKVHDRILEFLAVLKLRGHLRSPILAFVGPPGVGKTSLGQAIDAVLGRRFVRVSLGGIRDEAEIRGHRRTYIGALPGRILQGLRRAGSRNPVFMLDVVDMIGQDYRGDPAAVLLEVLDPEQNHAFQDHDIEVPFDLSNVLFIATVNVLDTTPPALRDRLEVIELRGDSDEEKFEIARRHLLPRQIEAHEPPADRVQVDDVAVRELIRHYTREAGVRNLDRELAAIARKLAPALVSQPKRATALRVDRARRRRWLGPPKYERTQAEQHLPLGCANGLPWTPTGGEILSVEVTRMPEKGRWILTGLLGDAMRESADTALSLLRSRAREWHLDWGHRECDVHVHVPAGAVPKDGPSAGIVILVAMVSLVSGRMVPGDWAMTGEITLRGRVLPVGGIREKVLAAVRDGVCHLILPRKNPQDLRDVLPQARQSLRVYGADAVTDAFDWIWPDMRA
jgi:ATP-dependent Lon protease